MAHNAFDHVTAFVQKNDADLFFFEVHGDTVGGLGEHDQFTCHTVLKTADFRYTVGYRQYLTDLLDFGSLGKIGEDLFSLLCLLRGLAFPKIIILEKHRRAFFKVGKRFEKGSVDLGSIVNIFRRLFIAAVRLEVASDT